LIRLRENGNFGLARDKWEQTLTEIRKLPQTYERNYPFIPEKGDDQPEN
jgi:hypothetical protein